MMRSLKDGWPTQAVFWLECTVKMGSGTATVPRHAEGFGGSLEVEISRPRQRRAQPSNSAKAGAAAFGVMQSEQSRASPQGHRIAGARAAHPLREVTVTYSCGPPSSAGASGRRAAPRINSRSWSENIPLKRGESMICSRCSGGILRRFRIAVRTWRCRSGGSWRI